MPVCSRLGKVYTRKAYDFNKKEVVYNVDLVEDVYHNSCICQSTTSSKNNHNDLDISVLSFYTERKEHLIVEIEQRKKVLSRKRQEVEDEESTLLKRRKELDLVNEIMNL